MFPWSKMFPFPKEYMKDDIFKQTDVEGMMNKAMKNKIPAPHQMLDSTNFFEQSFDMLNRIQSKKKKHKKTGFDANVFETHEDVIIRFPLSPEEKILELKTTHDTTTCYIENVPHNGNKQSIKLPCTVKSNGTKAIYKNGIVEIKIPKETNIPLTKIPIEILKHKK
ncbi:Hsp20/alpha crystallin family protein [Sutcliffiella deserti]|uniref:Hsp20/alpha crystallin family protein n=1 Tax=Sutcliffiella deserti TaxID=2875501 RepID=UPI001CBCDD48|nr:Hsp20/alpha crystallin family protein [Sutcliffiella deserti]